MLVAGFICANLERIDECWQRDGQAENRSNSGTVNIFQSASQKILHGTRSVIFYVLLAFDWWWGYKGLPKNKTSEITSFFSVSLVYEVDRRKSPASRNG